MRRIWYLHPLLFALYPALAQFAFNAAENAREVRFVNAQMKIVIDDSACTSGRRSSALTTSRKEARGGRMRRLRRFANVELCSPPSSVPTCRQCSTLARTRPGAPFATSSSPAISSTSHVLM
jgi:hypothetical protein